MERYLFSPEDSVLFVGEGNFSFSLSFKKLNDHIKHITASCYEKEIKAEDTLQNISALEIAGVEVMLGVDATKLTSYPELKAKHFTCIIFNFPHIGGKMKIDKNRDLLRDFFASSNSLLALNSNCLEIPRRVLVSLCKGQGGTPADADSLRVWGDSWQVTEMAAVSGLVLRQVEPFQHALCPGYSSVGYRSKDVWFHTEEALVHVFQARAPLLVVPRISDMESLVSVETSAGLVGCERVYMETAGFTEIHSGNFMQLPQENSLEMYLFKRLKSKLEDELENLVLIHPTELHLHSNYNSDSNVPCVLRNGNFSWLRSNLFEVLDNFQPENCLTYGPIFNCITKDFNVSPSRQQAVIRCCDVDKIVDVATCWISELLSKNSQDIKIENENLWTMYCSNQIIAQKVGRHLIIELSNVACIKYKLHGFRDLLEARISEEGSCILASLYPRTHVLDVCFLEGPQFSEDKLWAVLWRALGHCLEGVEQFDLYAPDNEDWVSRGYRLQYRSSAAALSRSAAVALHQNTLANALLESQVATRIL